MVLLTLRERERERVCASARALQPMIAALLLHFAIPQRLASPTALPSQAPSTCSA
jgi:hypothetical protein